jgi:hypothetical protein
MKHTRVLIATALWFGLLTLDGQSPGRQGADFGFDRDTGGSSGMFNLRVSPPTDEGREVIVTVECAYNGLAGPTAYAVPVFAKKGEKSVSGWFGSDMALVTKGKGLISIKCRFFNDQPGVPAEVVTDRVRMLLLNETKTSVIQETPFAKTIKWGNPNAKPVLAEDLTTLLRPALSPEQAAQAKAKAEAEAKARAVAEARAREEALAREEARQKAEAEAKVREASAAKAKAEADAREQARLAAEAEAQRLAEAKLQAEEAARKTAESRRLAEEKRAGEEKARLETEARAKAEAELREKARLAAEQEARQREEARRKAEDEIKSRAEAEAKAKAEAEEREKARLAAEAETKRLAEEKRLADEKLKQEAEARRLADEKKAADAQERAAAEARARVEAEEREKARIAAVAEEQRLAEERRQAEDRARTEALARKLAEERRVTEEKLRQEAEAKARAEAEESDRARQRAAEEARAVEQARQKAAEEARAQQEAETKARAEAEEREKARATAAAEAQRLAAERTAAEAKAQEEARALAAARQRAAAAEVARAEAEARAKTEAEARAKAEAEAKNVAQATGAAEPIKLASNLKTEVRNVDVVATSLDRSQRTFVVEFDYKDNLGPKAILGVNVLRSTDQSSQGYFVSAPAELGKSRRPLLLFPVKFQPPPDAPASKASSFSTDQVLVYLAENATAPQANLFPATMVLPWRAPGAAGESAPIASDGSSLTLDSFRQNDLYSGFAKVKYKLVSPSATLRALIYDSAAPASADFFAIDDETIKAGKGSTIVEIKVKSDAKTTEAIIKADTIEVELVDPTGKVLTRMVEKTPMRWSKPKSE